MMVLDVYNHVFNETPPLYKDHNLGICTSGLFNGSHYKEMEAW